MDDWIIVFGLSLAAGIAMPVGAALAGYFWLLDYPLIVSCIMVFSAGGILYVIFQDIAPQAKLERHWAPPLGAVGGFLLGLVGKMMISP